MTCVSSLLSIVVRHPWVWIFPMTTRRSVRAKMVAPQLGVSYRQHESGTELCAPPSTVCFQSVYPNV